MNRLSGIFQRVSNFFPCWMGRSCTRASDACIRTVGTLSRLLLILYFVLAGLLLLVRFALLPNIAHFKPDIERSVSAAIGRPLTIGAMQANWSGMNPTLTLRNIIVRDTQGRSTLGLPTVSASISWLSLFALDLRFSRIEIDQPNLDVQRQLDGRLYVGGFLIDTQKKSDGKALDWLFAQRHVAIRAGSLQWTDLYVGSPTVQVSKVNFVLNNRWHQHRFALTATPPPTIAAPVDVRGDFSHPVFARHIGDFSQWSGELYTDVQQADLAVLKPYVNYSAQLAKGYGSVRSWLSLAKGRVVEVTADVRLLDVVGTLGKELPPFDMAEVSGRLIASEKLEPGVRYLPAIFGQSGHRVSLIDFVVRKRDGVQLPPTTVQETYIAATSKHAEKIELNAKLVDLQTLAGFAEHLPLPPDQRQMLSDFFPRGQLKNFNAKWEGTYPNIVSYQLQGGFADLSIAAQPAQLGRPKAGKVAAKAAVPAIPGFDHLSGTIDANEKGGRFNLLAKGFRVQLPGYLSAPDIAFDAFKMDADWQFLVQDKLRFHVAKLEFQQDTMRGVLSGQHVFAMRQTEPHQPGEVDVSATLSGVDIKRIERFIPANAPEHLRHWLGNALLGGRLDDVSVRLKGDLAQFPFITADGKPTRNGEFLIKGKIVDGKLDFAPGLFSDDGVSPLWPVIDSIKGSIVFDHSRMEIKGESGKTLGANLSKVSAVIADLAHPNSVIDIDGTVNAPLQTMLQYVNASPVNVWLGRFLQDTKTTAPAQLALQLNLPLMHLHESRAHGALQFLNNDVVLQPGMPSISAVNGKLEFTEKGVNLNTLRGTLLGGATVATGGSQRDGSVRVVIDGLATAEGIKRALPAQFPSRISNKITGSARYSATISVKKHQPDITIDSSLQGLGLDFPAPLRKQGADALPLHFELSALPSTEANFLKDEIKIGLGKLINVRYLRRKELAANGANAANSSWQVLRGGIGVNAPAPQPDSGLNANIDFQALSLDDWQNVLNSSTHSVVAPSTPSTLSRTLISATDNAANTASGVALSTTAETSTSAVIDLASYISPDVIAVRASELQVMGKKIQNIVVGASHQRGVWQANIDSTQASGYLSWSEAKAGQTAGTATARLSRLFIPQSAAADVSDLLEGKNTNTQIPGLDIVAEEFELFNKKFGRLELLASNSAVSAGREWRISKLSLKNEDAEFKGTGKWTNRANGSFTDLNYQLDIGNAGKLLDRLGFVDVVRGGKGKLEGDVHWNGLPFSLDTPSMSGQIQLNLATGQFLKVDPGAAKLLGVLSMQSLARRFKLDFRDVFSEGFAFDSIVGSAQIQQGIAKTENLKMRSVNASVLLDGTADIAKETQNLHVAVIPEINAGTASVMYALAVNPAIGLGTFLAQLFLRAPLARAFTYEYQVTGSWKEPTVNKYDKNRNLKPTVLTETP